MTYPFSLMVETTLLKYTSGPMFSSGRSGPSGGSRRVATPSLTRTYDDGAVGYMPQAAPTLCCQKLEAIERWILASAPAN
jgi:hypothetical protein